MVFNIIAGEHFKYLNTSHISSISELKIRFSKSIYFTILLSNKTEYGFEIILDQQNIDEDATISDFKTRYKWLVEEWARQLILPSNDARHPIKTFEFKSIFIEPKKDSALDDKFMETAKQSIVDIKKAINLQKNDI